MNIHQHALITGLLQHDDLRERLSAVVDRTRSSQPLSAAERSGRQRVAGCVSPVWLVSTMTDGRCCFRCDAESPLVRGLVALTADFFSKMTPAEIVGSYADPLELLDLKRGLSPTRRHGLAAVATAIREYASAQLAASSLPADQAGPTNHVSESV